MLKYEIFRSLAAWRSSMRWLVKQHAVAARTFYLTNITGATTTQESLKHQIDSNKRMGYKHGRLNPISGPQSSQWLRDEIRKHKTFQKGFTILELIKDNKQIIDESIISVAFQQFCKIGYSHGCFKLLNLCFNNHKLNNKNNNIKRDIYLYTTIMNTFSHFDLIDKVYPKYYNIMIENDKIIPNIQFVTALLKGCKKQGNIDLANQIVNNIILKYDMIWDKPLYTTLITIYGKAGHINKAEKMFEKMLNDENINKPSLGNFGAIFNAFANNINARQCLILNEKEKYDKYGNMIDKIMYYKNIGENKYNLKFDSIHYIAILKAYLNFNEPNTVIKMYNQMLQENIQENASIFGILQNAYLRLMKLHIHNNNNNNRIQIQTNNANKSICERNTNDENDRKLLKEYLDNICFEIPNEMMENNLQIDFNHLQVMYDALLTYYDPLTQWNKKIVIKTAETWMTQYNRGHWIYQRTRKNSCWAMDLHGMRIREALFWLKYSFVNEINPKQNNEYYNINNINNNNEYLMIIVGRGKHRSKTNATMMDNDNNNSNNNEMENESMTSSIKQRIKLELLQWEPAINAIEPENNPGCLMVHKNEIRNFYEKNPNLTNEFLNLDTFESCPIS